MLKILKGMTVFEKRYEPRIKGDKITIVDKRNRCRYVIWPSSISVKYVFGLFSKKIDIHMVEYCIYHSNYIVVIDNKGREIKIDCFHLSSEAVKVILDFLEKSKITVRKITPNLKKKDSTNLNYSFDVEGERLIGWTIFIALAYGLIDCAILADSLANWPYVLVFTGFFAVLACIMLSQLYSIRVEGDSIEIRGGLKKKRVITLKDISGVRNYTVRLDARHGGAYRRYACEAMDLYSKKGPLKRLCSIDEMEYRHYHLFKQYLNDNGIPFYEKDSKPPFSIKGTNRGKSKGR